MNWKFFDRARRQASPVELDLIESYAQGKIRRRDFLKRGTIIGLSAPFMGSIIAACGGSGGSSDATDAPSGTSGSGTDAPSGSNAPGTNAPGTNAPASQGGELIVAVQQGDSSTGLDPVNMLDLGTYGILAQSFEPLVGLADDGGIGPTGLATEWEPNEAGDVWTFTLREGVKWQDGSDFTSADVAATMDRLVEVGNAFLDGVITQGAVDASDPLKAVFQLEAPNGNFPTYVSLFNAQGLITPVNYEVGSTLDANTNGTGPWILERFEASTFTSRFVPNPDWWGGGVNLDAVEFRGFEQGAVAAMQARDIDVIQQFPAIQGDALLNDPEFTVLTPPSAAHREVWFNMLVEPWQQKPARQAVAYAINRQRMIDSLFQGQAQIGNDHPVHPTVPFFNADAVEQREQDLEMARSLVAEAGLEGATVQISTGDLLEIPELAALIQQDCAQIGLTVEVATQSNSTFYENAWCPELYNVESSDPATKPCEHAAAFGIVDYGHRPVPDLYIKSAFATGGVWNSSNYANDELDQAFSDYQASVDVDGQTETIGRIQSILNEDVPVIFPYFYNYLSGHDNSVSGYQPTALGHMDMTKASIQA